MFELIELEKKKKLSNGYGQIKFGRRQSHAGAMCWAKRKY